MGRKEISLQRRNQKKAGKFCFDSDLDGGNDVQKIPTGKVFNVLSQFIKVLIHNQLSEVSWEDLVSIPHPLIILTKGFPWWTSISRTHGFLLSLFLGPQAESVYLWVSEFDGSDYKFHTPNPVTLFLSLSIVYWTNKAEKNIYTSPPTIARRTKKTTGNER